MDPAYFKFRSMLAKEDIISIDPTKFKDDTELAELIYAQIIDIYA